MLEPCHLIGRTLIPCYLDVLEFEQRNVGRYFIDDVVQINTVRIPILMAISEISCLLHSRVPDIHPARHEPAKKIYDLI